jgi:hypothetical protein
MSAALGALAARAESEAAARGRRSWVARIPLGDELAALARELDDPATETSRWLSLEQAPIGYVAATFVRPPLAPRVSNLELQIRPKPGAKGKVAFRASRLPSGEWSAGPDWLAPDGSDPYWAHRFPLVVRARELGAALVLAFAGAPEAHLLRGGRLTGECCVCGRTLRDPTSVGLGIGPECRENMAPAFARLSP